MCDWRIDYFWFSDDDGNVDGNGDGDGDDDGDNNDACILCLIEESYDSKSTFVKHLDCCVFAKSAPYVSVELEVPIDKKYIKIIISILFNYF